MKALQALALALVGALMLAATYLAVTIGYDDYTDGGGFWWTAFLTGWAYLIILALLAAVGSKLLDALADIERPKREWS